MSSGTLRGWASASALCSALAACNTAGSSWMAEPLTPDDTELEQPRTPQPTLRQRSAARTDTLVLESDATSPADVAARTPPARIEGRVLGQFRNTYYDFPSEADFEGPPVAVKDPGCRTIRSVPRGFFEALCVQGSGTLASGATVSFSKRDCGCAELCPRTGQRICFDALEASRFPWGRGAMGQPITPLLTVAVDSNVIALGTAVYIPELDGLPRDPAHSAFHDGCFIAQDRGIKVVGQHVDVFTGEATLTQLWNTLVPSNRGVTVVLDHPKCLRAN